MNKDQVFGKVEQAVGRVKQSDGETLGNEKLANQGVVDQGKGDAKDAAKEVQQSHQKAATDKAHEMRNKISQSVKNAKDKASEKIDEFRERHSVSGSAIQSDVPRFGFEAIDASSGNG